MNDKELKSKIAKIISGSMKSAIHDHPEYLSKDRKYIVRRSMSSIAKRASGNVLRLLRTIRLEDSEGLPPMKKGLPFTARMLPMVKLELFKELFDDGPPTEFAEVSQHHTEELIASTRDIRERAERNMADRLESQFSGKPRC